MGLLIAAEGYAMDYIHRGAGGTCASSWARLIAKIYEVNRLVCPREYSSIWLKLNLLDEFLQILIEFFIDAPIINN